VSVLVADFKNDTGDAVFEGTLEPAFGTLWKAHPLLVATAAPRHTGLPHKLQPGATMLDEPLARLVADARRHPQCGDGAIRNKR